MYIFIKLDGFSPKLGKTSFETTTITSPLYGGSNQSFLESGEFPKTRTAMHTVGPKVPVF